MTHEDILRAKEKSRADGIGLLESLIALGRVTQVDITKALAAELKAPFTLTPMPDTRSLIAALRAHTADLGFLAYETKRAEEVDVAGFVRLAQIAEEMSR